MSSKIIIPKICEFCGKNFIAKTTVTRYCSHKCNQRHYKVRKREEKVQISLEAPKKQKQLVQIPNPVGNKEYYSIKESAELIGISRWTIHRLIKKGAIQAAKFGRRTIIKRAEIEKLF